MRFQSDLRSTIYKPNYTVSQKNIRDIINYNLKKDYQILIIFCENIPGATGH